MAHAILNNPYPLRLQVVDGNPSLYPRATIYNEAETPLGTVPLLHIADGLYGASTTFITEETFSVVYLIYEDDGFTTLAADYERSAEEVEVTSELSADVWDALVDSHLGANTMGEALAIVRGLLQHNHILDNTTYNAKGLLTGGRFRIFQSKADADAEATPIATYTIAGIAEVPPDDHLGQRLKVTRDP